jgi:hypothetical protein
MGMASRAPWSTLNVVFKSAGQLLSFERIFPFRSSRSISASEHFFTSIFARIFAFMKASSAAMPKYSEAAKWCDLSMPVFDSCASATSRINDE